MININLCDNSFAHLETEDGIYSMTDNKKPRYTRYVKVDSGWEGVTLFTDSYLMSSEHSKHPGTNIGLLVETRETNPSIYADVDKYIDNYDFLLTYDKELLDKYPEKTKFYPFGGCWVEPDNYGFPSKSKSVSMIYSHKTQASGHRLRHNIAQRVTGVDLWGAGAGKPFDTKEEALSPYRFSIVIENTQNPYYFSEKLLDCMALGTIPIYHGATEIGSFFNEKGIITFDTLDDLDEILSSLSPELYAELLPYAEKNQKLVKKYDTQEDWIFENVLVKDNIINQNITEDLDDRDIRTYVDGYTQDHHLNNFLRAGGDDLLLDFPHLNANSVVWDIGSYLGDFSVEVHDKYGCRCFGFEPQKDAYDKSIQKSKGREKLKFFNYGLGAKNETLNITLSSGSNKYGGDGSSFYLEGDRYNVNRKKDITSFCNDQGILTFSSFWWGAWLNSSASKKEPCVIRNIGEVFEELEINSIDLLQMNIEGGEYSILEGLLDAGLADKVHTFLIQFHYYGEFPVLRRDKILERFSETHTAKFSYPFVWECWSKK